MQGTGTQADPLIPADWDEVIEAVGTSGAYVSFPSGGGEYNMNDISPTGMPMLEVKCTRIDGNGWNLKNIYSTSGVIQPTGKVTINDLNFVDFEFQGSKFFDTSGSTNRQAIINNCKFSGILTAGKLFNRSNYSTSYVFQLNNCSINVRADNDAVVFGDRMDNSSGKALVQFCNVQISGNSSNPFGYAQMQNCFVQGKMSPTGDNGIKLVSGSNYNIIVADLSQSASSALLTCPNGINLINSDLLPAGTSIPAGMKGCTTEQLKDASYLAEDEEVGFPIADENNTYRNLLRSGALNHLIINFEEQAGDER